MPFHIGGDEMTLSMKNFEQKEWDLYDTNLGQALESVET